MSLLSYTELNSFNLNIGSTDVLLTSDDLAYDGTTRIMVEAFFSDVILEDGLIDFHLYDNGSDVGILQEFQLTRTGDHEYSGYGAVFLTPSAANHEYAIVSDGITASTSQINDRSWLRIQDVATELDYTERTTDFSGSNPYITAGAVVFDGSTRVKVDVFCPSFATPDDADVDLLDNGSSIGTFGEYGATQAFGDDNQIVPMFLRRFLTPSAGSHTFSTEINGSSVFAFCNPAYCPGFMRVTNA